MSKYVIGSGWFCRDPEGSAGKVHGHPQVGLSVIRSIRWHEVWKYFLFRYAAPAKVLITDSASAFKPPKDDRVEWVNLDQNYQYKKGTPYNGWLRGFMMGAWYAWSCNAHYIYVEQDCLVLGQNWVNVVLKHSMEQHPLYGAPYRNPIQQSLVFLPYAIIPRYLHLLSQLPGGLNCEARFHKLSKIKKGIGYKILPFGYGRIRPIDFQAKHFYAQHWTKDELLRLGQREKVNGMIRSLLKGDGNDSSSVHTDTAEQQKASKQESTPAG